VRRQTKRWLKCHAHRIERRVEKERLRLQGQDYTPALKPRLTGWDMA
jgi:hypothetical protein